MIARVIMAISLLVVVGVWCVMLFELPYQALRQGVPAGAALLVIIVWAFLALQLVLLLEMLRDVVRGDW